MDINKIETVLYALKVGSFSKAAEKYSYTPSALTHIANSLENEIGTKFIKRTHTGIEPCNKEIIQRLQNICDEKNYICSLAKNNNRLTIGTYSSASKHLLPEIIRNFHKTHPEVHIDITVISMLSQLLDEDIDILFGVKQESKEHFWIEVMTDRYTAVFPKGHTEDTEFRFDKKYSETFIMSDEITVMKMVDENNFNGTVTINAHDDSSIIQMVKAEMGVAILPYLSVSQSEDVTVLPIDPPVTRVLGLNCKKNSPKKQLIKEFADFFTQQVNLSGKNQSILSK